MKIKGRPSKYRRKLNNESWRHVTRLVRIRDKHQCQICASKINLEVHHIRYKNKGKCIIGKEIENLESLITLCRKCHKQVHNDKKNRLNPLNN